MVERGSEGRRYPPPDIYLESPIRDVDPVAGTGEVDPYWQDIFYGSELRFMGMPGNPDMPPHNMPGELPGSDENSKWVYFCKGLQKGKHIYAYYVYSKQSGWQITMQQLNLTADEARSMAGW